MRPRAKAPAADPETEALDAVTAVYRELAERPVTRACELRTECCRFQLTGMVPFLTRGEALVAARALRRTGRVKSPSRDDGACPLLDADGRCLVYESRPFGCRTHFCAAAGGPYARNEVLDLIRRLEAIDARLGGDGPRPLPDALVRALRELD
jgi:Fe-S-cluster containining protein